MKYEANIRLSEGRQLIVHTQTGYRFLLWCGVFVAALLSCAVAGIRADSVTGWEILGPGGGGTMLRPTISPHGPDVAIVSCDMTGSYITVDGGQSWRIFNLGSRVDSVAFDPSDDETIYAGTNGLYRSEDRGMTWQLIWPDPETILRKRVRGDHAGVSFVAEGGYPGGRVKLIRVDPDDSNCIYVGFDGNPQLYTSEDGGVSWSTLRTFRGRRFYRLFIDPNSPANNRNLYVFTDMGLTVRIDGKWEESYSDFPAGPIRHVAGGFRYEDGNPVFVVVIPTQDREGRLTGGVLRSTDGGRTWLDGNNGFPRVIDESGSLRLPRFRDVACSEMFPDTLYIKIGDELPYGQAHVVPGFIFNPPPTWDRTSGFYKSTDGGTNWSCLQKWNWDLAPLAIDGGWINSRFGTEYMQLGDLGVSPTNPSICYSTDLYRALKTENGGENWFPVYCRQLEDGSVTTRGLDVTTCYGVHFDPFIKNRMFVTYTDIGLFKSENRGESWRSALDGVPHAWWNTAYWMVFDPDVRGKMWAVWGSAHDLPRHKMFRHGNVDKWRGGVTVSVDGGDTWRPADPGLPDNTSYTHILLDPKSPENQRTLYACGFGKGVYKSIDDGETWELRNTGLGENLNVWRMERNTRGDLYLVVFRDYRGNRETAGAVYFSDNGAQSWTLLNLPERVTGPSEIAAHPENTDVLYLAAWGESESGLAADGGVFRSEDAGTSWTRVLDRAEYVYSVTVDPENPKRVYAGTFESAAFASFDGGDNWERVRGYNFKWGHRVVPDPYDTQKIYITTFGGSVWYGPRLGVGSSVVEDVIEP